MVKGNCSSYPPSAHFSVTLVQGDHSASPSGFRIFTKAFCLWIVASDFLVWGSDVRNSVSYHDAAPILGL